MERLKQQRRERLAAGGSRPRFLLHVAVLLCLGMLGFLYGTQAVAEPAEVDQQHVEAQIKAAMLYKFLSYIEWPEAAFQTSDSAYRIVVMGAEPVAANLQEITREREVAGRRISVEEISSTAELDGAHMLFIGKDKKVNTEQLASRLRHRSVVTVTESQEGLNPLSVINLRVNDDKVNFDVSLPMAAEREVRVSSRMLAVAASVEKNR